LYEWLDRPSEDWSLPDRLLSHAQRILHCWSILRYDDIQFCYTSLYLPDKNYINLIYTYFTLKVFHFAPICFSDTHMSVLLIESSFCSRFLSEPNI
jgi:hypothetical protein